VLEHPRHGLDRHHVQRDAVGDLAGELEHRRHQGADVDRDRGLRRAHQQPVAVRRERAAVEVGALAGEDRAHRRHGLPHPGERTAERDSAPALDDVYA
jgi:hypothetical protein